MTDTVPKARKAAYFIPDAEPIYSFGSVAFTELHPDTDPAVIAGRHREEASDAYHVRGLETPEEIGEAIMLPTFIVQRHLEALGLAELSPDPAEAFRLKRGEALKRIRKCLKAAKGPLTMREITAASGVSYNSAIHTLKNRPDLFEATPAGRYRGCTMYAWSLKDADAGRTDPVRGRDGRGAAAVGRGKGR